MDKHDLLNTTIQMLDSAVSARSGDDAPSIMSSATTKSKKSHALSAKRKFVAQIGVGLQALARR